MKDINELIEKAEQGDIVAALTLGHIYEDGDGTEPSWEKALRYYEMAGYESNEEGAYRAALIHRSDKGKPRNGMMAGLMLSYGANAGSARCKGLLAEHYMNGDGMRQSMVAAAREAKEAMEGGDAYGRYILGLLTLAGRGTEQDVNRGLALMKESAYGGLTEAKYALGLCYEIGIGAERALLISEDWYLQAKRDGHEGAAYRLSLLGVSEENTSEVALSPFFLEYAQRSAPIDIEEFKKKRRDANSRISSFDDWF